jgi:nicotinamide riboside transporter PnuC
MSSLILVYISGIVITAGVAVAAGLLAKLAYLAFCVALSAWSSRKNEWDYLVLALWVAALTPFARRLVDLQAGWDATNIMLIAPFLVAGPMIPPILRRLRALDAATALFPGLAATCIFYCVILSLLRGNLAPTVIGLADWGVPLLFYFFVVTHRETIPGLLERLPAFISTNMLVLGCYGVWQFVDPPQWDRYWLNSADVGAFGIAEPFMVRVFSTMNSAGPFSCWMMVLIILSFGFKSMLMSIARVAGILSLTFTTVRTSWTGLALGLLFVIFSSGRRSARYAWGLIVAAALAAIVVTAVPEFGEVISQRFTTFGDLASDGSVLQREDISERMITLIANTPLGVGIGTLGRGALAADATQVAFTGPIDNGILEIIGSLGWLFGFAYCAALTTAVFLNLRRAGECVSAQRNVYGAAAIACLAALPITNIAAGVTGTIMWTMVALSVATARANIGYSGLRSTPEPPRRFVSESLTRGGTQQ